MRSARLLTCVDVARPRVGMSNCAHLDLGQFGELGDMGEDEAVRSSTAAELLHVRSRQTINNWIRDGLLQTTRTVGGQNRIPRESIDALIAVLAIGDPAERATALHDLRESNLKERERASRGETD